MADDNSVVLFFLFGSLLGLLNTANCNVHVFNINLVSIRVVNATG